MNERIREFVGQSHLDVYVLGKDKEKWEATVDKFAELLIQECANLIVAKGTDQVDFAPSQTGVRPEYWDMAQQIKQHFGVE